MTNQLIMDNYLLLLKSTVEVYVHGTLESSNDIPRKALKHGLDETMKHQANTYDLMKEEGWYKVDNVSSTNIKKVYDKCN